MDGIIAGAYVCKARGVSYNYEVVWERNDALLRWSGDVSHRSRRAFARGELPLPGGIDSGDAVRLGVAIWIEDYSRGLADREPHP